MKIILGIVIVIVSLFWMRSAFDMPVLTQYEAEQNFGYAITGRSQQIQNPELISRKSDNVMASSILMLSGLLIIAISSYKNNSVK